MQNFFLKSQGQKLENALYIVATPIGNLADITARALQTLSSVDFIICEDSQISSRLLNAYEIKDKKMLVYNDHSNEKNRQKILNLLQEKKSLALISDAGTPLISDPGYKLITFLRSQNQKIITIPGASSLTASLCASGIACDNFLFLGFLSSTSEGKENLIKTLPRNFTFVFFESPNRLLETLEILQKILKNRRICVAREITKIHEEFIVDDLQNIIDFFAKNQSKLRGEFVVIVEKAGKNDQEFSEQELIDEVKKLIKQGLSLKDLSQNLSEVFSVNKKDIYKIALDLNKKL